MRLGNTTSQSYGFVLDLHIKHRHEILIMHNSSKVLDVMDRMANKPLSCAKAEFTYTSKRV